MTDEPRKPHKSRLPMTQTTTQGTEIPIPKRGEFFRDLRKVAKPKPSDKRTDLPE